jgi:hypothetical protein
VCPYCGLKKEGGFDDWNKHSFIIFRERIKEV